MTLLSLFLLWPLLALMQTPDVLLKGSMLYGGIVLSGLPVTASYVAIVCEVRGQKRA